MVGSRDHIPHADGQEGRFGSDFLEKAAQGGSHPAGGPSPLGTGPVGSAGLHSRTQVLNGSGPQMELAFLLSVHWAAGERAALFGGGQLPEIEGDPLPFQQGVGQAAALPVG